MTDKTAIEKIRSLKRNAENDMPQYDYGWDAAIDKAIEALMELENQDEFCTWSGPDDEGLYRGSCGMNEWSCIDGTPEENGMVYCHKCGKKIKYPVVDSSPMLGLTKKINRCVDW